jgi:lipopolysaccharide biosynthesis glycosyltransferase
MQAIEITFIVDRKYIDPLIVTLHSLTDRIGSAYHLHLTLLYNITDEIDERYVPFFADIVATFIENRPGTEVRIIQLKGSPFDDYRRLHFNSTILNKLLVPQLIQFDTNLVFIIDAGVVFGKQLLEFFSESCLNATCPVSAFTEDKFNKDGQSRRYPAGVILLFNVDAYKAADTSQRVLSAYVEKQSEILYGEQDLLFYALLPEELGSFDPKYARLHFDLATFTDWELLNQLIGQASGDDYFYWKHVGSAKPWLQSIANPLAAPYFGKRSELAPKVSAKLDQLREIQKLLNLSPTFDIGGNQANIFRSYMNYLSRTNL